MPQWIWRHLAVVRTSTEAGIFFQSYFTSTDADEVAGIDANFGLDRFPPLWLRCQQTSRLIHVHDLLAPVDFDSSAVHLRRPGAIAGAILPTVTTCAAFQRIRSADA